MPVFALNSSRTFWKAACSLPPHREVTVIVAPAAPDDPALEPEFPEQAVSTMTGTIRVAEIRNDLRMCFLRGVAGWLVGPLRALGANNNGRLGRSWASSLPSAPLLLRWHGAVMDYASEGYHSSWHCQRSERAVFRPGNADDPGPGGADSRGNHHLAEVRNGQADEHRRTP